MPEKELREPRIKNIHPFDCEGVSVDGSLPRKKKPVPVFLGVLTNKTIQLSCPYLGENLLCTAPTRERNRRVCPYVYPHIGSKETKEKKPWEDVPTKYGRLMSLLEAYPGEIVSHYTIIEVVWRGKDVGPDEVRKVVYQLGLLNPDFRRHITAVAGQGLRYTPSENKLDNK